MNCPFLKVVARVLPCGLCWSTGSFRYTQPTDAVVMTKTSNIQNRLETVAALYGRVEMI